MNIPYKKIELLANVSIIAVVLLLGAVVVRQYLTGGGQQQSRSAAFLIQPGSKIDLPGVDWSKSSRTLLLALQKGCHFCTDSAPFYRRLAPVASEKNVRLVAVLPQEQSEARQYLADLGVTINDVRQASLDSLSVRGTPTLILVDEKGLVIDSWVGKLPGDGEAKVLNRIGLTDLH